MAEGWGLGHRRRTIAVAVIVVSRHRGLAMRKVGIRVCVRGRIICLGCIICCG